MLATLTREPHLYQQLHCRWFPSVYGLKWASLVAQPVKNPPAMQEIRFNSWVRKIPWRRDQLPTPVFLGFPGGSDSKESTWKAGDLGSLPGLGRFPGEANSYHSSSSLAWRIPWTEDPGRLESMGLQRGGYKWLIITHMRSAWSEKKGI